MTPTHWQIALDYFENCNCTVACPCTFSPGAWPTEGVCRVALAFHVTHGSYGNIKLDGLNVVMMIRSPGPVATGNYALALYLDERANEQQRQVLEAIFSGSAGGPMEGFAPLISTRLGVKTVPITFKIEGKRRTIEIPSILHMAIDPLPSLNPGNEIWVLNAHPFAPSVVLAIGDQNSTWTDYGMSWDNSGKHGIYASINWSNA